MINGDAGWLGWCSTIDQARAAAEAAVASADAVMVHGGETQAVVRVTGGDESFLEAWREHCDVGLYRTASRHVLRHVHTWPLGDVSPGVTMLFNIHRRPGMSADDFHQWWERSHAPIALQHHVGMWDYTQVSVVETIHGEHWDGFAVTQWPTLDDLMHRFSSGPEGTEALRHDAAQFTDPATLTRHLLDEHVLVEAPWPVDRPLPVGLARSVDGEFLGEEVGEVASDVLPPGMSVERRRTADGRERLDVLWRTATTAADVGDLVGRFDELSRVVAGSVVE
jgi:hypothetical protein